ncbi:MAG TPA: hypothetical protein VF941_17895 [Clostridia bacterium]
MIKLNRKIFNAALTRSTFLDHTEDYKNRRESYWAAAKKDYASKGKPLWNGTVCTIDAVSETTEEVIFELGICEYKDIIFPVTMKKENDYNPQYANVQCLIEDKEGNILFGMVDEKLVCVGGTLRIDDFPINGFGDIEKYMVDEIITETFFLPNNNISCIGFSSEKNIGTFVFKYTVKDSFLNQNSYLKRGEFSDEIIILKKDFKKYNDLFNERLTSISDLLLELKIL